LFVLKILTEFVLLVECALNDFQTKYAPVLNAFDQSLKVINNFFMFYNKQEKHICVFQFERDCFQDLNIHYSTLVFSRDSGIGLHLY